MTLFVNLPGLEALLQPRSEIRKHLLSLQWHSLVLYNYLVVNCSFYFVSFSNLMGKFFLAELQGWSSDLAALSNTMPQLTWWFKLHTPSPLYASSIFL